MRKLLFFLAVISLVVPLPAFSQGIFEGGSVDSLSVGLGAGLAASVGRGALVNRTYQSAAEAEMSAAQAMQVQTKAIQQYMKLGCQFEAKKQWENAEKSFRYVLKVSVLRDGIGSPKMVPTLQHLANVSAAQGNLYDAIGFQERVLGFAKNQKIPDPVSVINAEIALSNLCVQQQDYARAESAMQESYALCQTSPSLPEEKRLVVAHTYGKLLRKLKKTAQAQKIDPLAVEVSSQESGVNDAKTTEKKSTELDGAANTEKVASETELKAAAGTTQSEIVSTAAAAPAAQTASSAPKTPAINGH